MPFYDYKCTKCAQIFEIQKRMNEDRDPVCPKCNSIARRVFNVPRTIRSANDVLDTAGRQQSSSCSTCSSGVCSSCSGR